MALIKEVSQKLSYKKKNKARKDKENSIPSRSFLSESSDSSQLTSSDFTHKELFKGL